MRERKNGMGRTLREATVRLFNLCSVLDGLLGEHTPFLNHRHVGNPK